MNTEVSKIQHFPASFDTRRQPVLTKSQQHIVEMLKSGAKNGVPIDREDIIKAYIECMYGNSKTYCKAERMLNGDYTYKHLEISHQDPYIRIKSIAWFKNNLATCIIKGKVLAVPIIDIDA